MTVTVREHLQGTISHLQVKRRFHLAEASRLDDVLKALHSEIEALPRTEALPFPPNEGQYAGISIRWAVLLFLAEHANGPQTLAAIAEALRGGGATTKGQSFNSNVSAVLSVMGGKGEVEKSDLGFALTPSGRTVWDGIRHSDKFLSRATGSEGSE
jgi:hypothetical protein